MSLQIIADAKRIVDAADYRDDALMDLHESRNERLLELKARKLLPLDSSGVCEPALDVLAHSMYELHNLGYKILGDIDYFSYVLSDLSDDQVNVVKNSSSSEHSPYACAGNVAWGGSKTTNVTVSTRGNKTFNFTLIEYFNGGCRIYTGNKLCLLVRDAWDCSVSREFADFLNYLYSLRRSK